MFKEVIKIFVNFTDEEKIDIEALESEYMQRLSELEELMEKLHPAPDTDALFVGINAIDNPDEWQEAYDKENNIYEEWYRTGSKEWRKTRKEWDNLNDEFNKERYKLFRKAEEREFSKLEGDPDKILKDAKNQVLRLVRELPESFGKNSILELDRGYAEYRINSSLELHIEVLKEYESVYKEFTSFVDEVLRRYDPGVSLDTLIDKVLLPIVKTKYPKEFISPTDKVSSLAFSGDLTGEELKKLAMENKKSKKQITTLASINFDNLNGSIKINGRQELTAYDREVHDAIITLYVDEKNEYITPQMIYRVITGNPNAYLKDKQAEAISDSITKCMYSKLTINADEEAKAYGFDSFKYEGNLINGERVTATLNGKTLECLHILRPPVLYEYASKKKQIGRVDIKLLNSPPHKTEEIIMIQGYLYRRILSMKNGLSKNIVYDTVYNQIEIEAASDGALRKKKAKVREHVKNILDYWKQENFIAGYKENTKGKTVYSVTILL